MSLSQGMRQLAGTLPAGLMGIQGAPQKVETENESMLITRRSLNRRDFLKRLAALLGFGLGGGFNVLLPRAFGHVGNPSGLDALQHLAYDDLKVFTDWLGREGVQGYIGELNWPNNQQRGFGDEAQWNALGEKWYQWADVSKLWVTMWCVDEYQRWGGFWLTTYVSVGDGQTRPISRPLAQAPVYEAHPSTADYRRGINLSGAERWEEGINSNSKLGTYGVDYWYASQESMDYLASRGTKIIRLPFRWERIQPTLGGALNTFELTQLKNCVARAAKAGLRVILDLHNYAGYHLSMKKNTSREYKLGSSRLPASYLYDVWRRLSDNFKSDSAVVSYSIMNEPVNIPAAGYASPQKAWESYSQDVVTNIRNNGDDKLTMVPGYHWSMARLWAYHHPRRWISDSANNYLYEAHHYFDEGSGHYNRSYDDAVAYWRSQGY